jgi:hypothetical protein
MLAILHNYKAVLTDFFFATATKNSDRDKLSHDQTKEKGGRQEAAML